MFDPYANLFWDKDGSIGWRDKAPDRTNQQVHKKNLHVRRRRAEQAARKARKRNRK